MFVNIIKIASVLWAHAFHMLSSLWSSSYWPQWKLTIYASITAFLKWVHNQLLQCNDRPPSRGFCSVALQFTFDFHHFALTIVTSVISGKIISYVPKGGNRVAKLQSKLGTETEWDFDSCKIKKGVKNTGNASEHSLFQLKFCSRKKSQIPRIEQRGSMTFRYKSLPHQSISELIHLKSSWLTSCELKAVWQTLFCNIYYS